MVSGLIDFVVCPFGLPNGWLVASLFFSGFDTTEQNVVSCMCAYVYIFIAAYETDMVDIHLLRNMYMHVHNLLGYIWLYV